MCKFKNDQAVEVLKGFRKIDSEGIKSFSDEDLSKLFLLTKLLSKECEKYEEVIKESLVERKIADQSFPEFGQKVVLTEGKQSTVYDNAKIFTAVGKADYLAMTNIVAYKAKNLGHEKILEQ